MPVAAGRKPILFVSSSIEESHLLVRRAIEARGHQVVVFAVDQVLSGAKGFTIRIDESGTPNVYYAGTSIGPTDVSAAWYWKPLSFRLPGAEDNVAKQLSLVNEMTQLSNSVWGLYPADLWLNSPTATWLGNQKLPQLRLAQQVGFSVPQTILSNSWDAVIGALLDDDGSQEVVAKMHRGVLADHNQVKAMYTTRLTLDAVTQLLPHASPFPGLFQPFVAKRREWRVTVVGDEVFSAAIYTSDAAKDDWRRLQLQSEHVEFRSERLPVGIAERCVEFLARSSLGYGAFDLIETPEGEVVFLECNPSGQFAWLVDGLGCRIADALAEALITIAEKQP